MISHNDEIKVKIMTIIRYFTLDIYQINKQNNQENQMMAASKQDLMNINKY